MKETLIDENITRLKKEEFPRAYMIGGLYALWQFKNYSSEDIELMIKNDCSANDILDMIVEVKRNPEILKIIGIDSSEIDISFNLDLFIKGYYDEMESMYKKLKTFDSYTKMIKYQKIKRKFTLNDLFSE